MPRALQLSDFDRGMIIGQEIATIVKCSGRAIQSVIDDIGTTSAPQHYVCLVGHQN